MPKTIAGPATFDRMPIGVRLEPEHIVAPAGADIDGEIVLSNPGWEAVHVRLVVSGEIAGWATVEPGDLVVDARAEFRCRLSFRLPRGAPGGVGAVPFLVRVLSDQEGEGGATATGSLDVTGEAELALRLLPATFRGTLSASTRIALDNLGAVPARVQLMIEAPESVVVEAEPDSVIIEPNSTAFASITVRPVRRLISGSPRAHEFWLRVEPLGGARISAPATMMQRSMIVGLLPQVVAAALAGLLVVALLVRALGGGGDQVTASAPLTTLPPTTTTTAAPTTTAPGEPGAPPPTIPLKDRRIAFQSKRDGNFEIYTSAPDGSDQKNLTNSFAHDGEPAWSPDHTRIAFDSDRAGGFDIFVMNADGSGLVQLTTELAPDGYPTWSPDGTRIAFLSFRDGNSEIYVMNADGTNAQRLTKNMADDSKPAWSPDGSRIAFHSDRDGNYEIYVMNVDGSDQRNLSNHPSADKNPAWAPTSSRLAFDSTRDADKSEIYVMGADGTLPVRLTNNDDSDSWPAFAPDGRQVVYQSDQHSDVELYVVGVGGGTPRRLTENPGEDGEPSWS